MQKSLDSGGNRTFRLKLPNFPDRMGSRTATHKVASQTFLTYGMKRTIPLVQIFLILSLDKTPKL